MKKCKKCFQEKPLSDYGSHKKTKDGLNTWCRKCHIEVQQKYNLKRKWHTRYKGVYGIFENGVCLYVGESSQINHRLSDHKSRNPYLSNHPAYVMGIIEETPNHKEREQYWINVFQPLYNLRLQGH